MRLKLIDKFGFQKIIELDSSKLLRIQEYKAKNGETLTFEFHHIAEKSGMYVFNQIEGARPKQKEITATRTSDDGRYEINPILETFNSSAGTAPISASTSIFDQVRASMETATRVAQMQSNLRSWISSDVDSGA